MAVQHLDVQWNVDRDHNRPESVPTGKQSRPNGARVIGSEALAPKTYPSPPRLIKKAAKDERAIFDFVQELYKKRRVSDRNYKRVQGFLGDKGMVELVGILGYYTSVSMILNIFNVTLPEGTTPYFTEPK